MMDAKSAIRDATKDSKAKPRPRRRRRLRPRKAKTEHKKRPPEDVFETLQLVLHSDNTADFNCECGQDFNGKMAIQCSKCRLWFHCSCVGFDNVKATRMAPDWFCAKCKSAGMCAVCAAAKCILCEKSVSYGKILCRNCEISDEEENAQDEEFLIRQGKEE